MPTAAHFASWLGLCPDNDISGGRVLSGIGSSRSGLADVSGTAERHRFKYYRHGTLSLYAALDVKTGKVHGKTAARHTSDEFVAFLHQVVRQCKRRQEIHIILDNLSAHKTAKVEASDSSRLMHQ
jgi:DDE superfamily endonuclease